MVVARPRSLARSDRTRRYPILGGVAGHCVPVAIALLASRAFMQGEWDLAVGAGVLGGIAYRLWRSVVIEVSAPGLTRGFLLRGAFLGRATVILWPAVTEVYTRWCRPHDDSALETIVRGRDGAVIRLSTAMGLGVYFTCLAEVVQRAPGARRTGLTDAALADGPPARRHAVSVATTVGALSLVLLVLVAVFWALAQGRP